MKKAKLDGALRVSDQEAVNMAYFLLKYTRDKYYIYIYIFTHYMNN